jgi:hypothetical protein
MSTVRNDDLLVHLEDPSNRTLTFLFLSPCPALPRLNTPGSPLFTLSHLYRTPLLLFLASHDLSFLPRTDSTRFEVQSFGLKNKNKSTKVQQQVKTIQAQQAAKGINQEVKDKQKEKERLQAKKALEQKKKDEISALFTGPEIVQPKVPFGVGAFFSFSPFFHFSY